MKHSPRISVLTFPGTDPTRVGALDPFWSTLVTCAQRVHASDATLDAVLPTRAASDRTQPAA